MMPQRFWSKVRKTKTCWLWTGSKYTNGYGRFFVNPTVGEVLVHRFSYTQHRKNPKSKCVLHRCDVKLCIRPSHLFLGTIKDNNQDMWKKKRGVLPMLCGEKHGYAVLSVKDVRFIRSQKLVRGSIAALARKFGVSWSGMDSVIKHRTWKHDAC